MVSTCVPTSLLPGTCRFFALPNAPNHSLLYTSASSLGTLFHTIPQFLPIGPMIFPIILAANFSISHNPVTSVPRNPEVVPPKGPGLASHFWTCPNANNRTHTPPTRLGALQPGNFASPVPQTLLRHCGGGFFFFECRRGIGQTGYSRSARSVHQHTHDRPKLSSSPRIWNRENAAIIVSITNCTNLQGAECSVPEKMP